MDNIKLQLFLTTTLETEKLTGLVFIPFRESILYVFQYAHGELKIYSHWSNLTAQEQTKLQNRWPQQTFIYTHKKQLAQSIVKWVQKQAKPSEYTTFSKKPSKHKILIKQKLRRDKFVIFNDTIMGFDYKRALQMKLVKDHLGKAPEIRKTVITNFYGIFFPIVMFLFALSIVFVYLVGSI